MADEEDSLTIVGDFLSHYYHEEFDDVVSATNALEEMLPRMDYRWAVAQAFKQVLNRVCPPGTLTELVRQRANPFARDDEEAKAFLQRTYNLNLFELAIDPEELKHKEGADKD
jgi:hypothetical protein